MNRLAAAVRSWTAAKGDSIGFDVRIADIPFPAPENVAAKRCASEKRAF